MLPVALICDLYIALAVVSLLCMIVAKRLQVEDVEPPAPDSN